MLENKRLTDRIDSLEFYAKTKTNGSGFYNMKPNSTSSSSSSSSTINRERGRSPMPPLISSTIPRTRRPSIGRASVDRQIYPSSSSIYSPSTTTSYYDRASTRASVERQLYSPSISTYDRSARSSVERQIYPSSSSSVYTPSYYDKPATTSHYDKPPIAPLPSSISMLRLPSSSSSNSRYGNDRYTPSLSSSPYTYTGSRPNRYLYDNDTSSVIMRNREKSIDRSILPSSSSINNTLTRMRRSSFADTSKYY